MLNLINMFSVAPTVVEVESPDIEIKGHSEEKGSSLCEISPTINQHCSFAESAEEPNKLIDNKPEPWKTSRTESPLKGLFLSNPSLLSLA
ncbi:hypothetical protein GIB67_020556 [Kingdonia uniflora]|uniref:Uncharacterized protein n=1 Tax=Kingdonia uniflora TaxID=39325 RepID=A0A7J7NLI5_9MAGN|nr:hypothetical protein GIB67_020556 [Kingdonia uniflora]